MMCEGREHEQRSPCEALRTGKHMIAVQPIIKPTRSNSQSHQLQKASVVRALPPRREPYWAAPLSRGRFVGLRKIDARRATWIARYRNEAGKQKYKALGNVTSQFGFDRAKTVAAEWFEIQESAITATEIRTVIDACKAYVKSLILTNGAVSGHDAELRLGRTVYKSDLGKKQLSSVRITHVKNWRDGLKLKPANSNRTLTSLKAALNMAVANRQCVATLAIEWNEVQPLPNDKKRRTLHLDLNQRRHLLAHCGEGSFHDFMEAAALTGARGGELADAKVSQFDARTGSMTFVGKTRLKVEPRTVPISSAAIALFKRMADGKRPDDLLFMRDENTIGASYCEVATRRYCGLAKIDRSIRWRSYDWGDMVRAAVTAADLPAATVLYTLRHSWITTTLTSGMGTLDVARLAGTSLLMIEKHYDHLVSDAARLRLANIEML
jgi:integrase